MSEGDDYTEHHHWAHHDFKAEKKNYDTHVRHSYAQATSAGKTTKDVLAMDISTLCRRPLFIIVDETGSMGEWPAIMFSKLPYLEHEAKDYLGEDTEICFLAIGDAHNPYRENFPLQARPFARGTALKERLEELVIEKKGGANMCETYELAALFIARMISMPFAERPVCIFIGDEMPYATIGREVAESVCGVKIEKTLTVKQVFDELKAKSAVYFIRKPYNSRGDENSMSDDDHAVLKCWRKLVGEENVCDLPTAERVVDVIFGILAHEAQRTPDFRKEIESRQTPEQIAMVYASLKNIHTAEQSQSGT